MQKTDPDALLCDLAETYHIYSLDALPLPTVAILAAGLRDNSRIKLKMAGALYTTTDTLLGGILDRLSLLVYANTKDAAKGRNYPAMVTETMYAKKPDDEIKGFASGKDFDDYRRQLIEEVTNGN